MHDRAYELINELESLYALNDPPAIRKPSDLFGLLISTYGSQEQEHFIAVTLNGAHKIINTHVISKGLVNRTLVHPREVFRSAIKDNATAIIIAHNHPSGTLKPSPEDLSITDVITDAGDLLGIPVLDHIIFSYSGALSIKEEPKLRRFNG